MRSLAWKKIVQESISGELNITGTVLTFLTLNSLFSVHIKNSSQAPNKEQLNE